MRLWIDDLRPPPSDYDLVARNAPDAIWYLLKGNITHVGFDHDYGQCEPMLWSWITQARLFGADRSFVEQQLQTIWTNPDGIDCGNGSYVADFVAIAARDLNLPPFTYSFQTANPIGKEHMTGSLREAEQHWVACAV